tara:strand:+ start:787 stop:1395 length:609 start_codon:yes stop_codon:yes gene_type:complete
MKTPFIYSFLLSMTICFTAPVYAVSIGLYDELADARDMSFLTPKEEYESTRKAIAVLAGCKLDRLCALMVMHRMSKNEDNLLYIHFYNKMNKHRDEIMFDAMHCKDPKLTQARVVQASCLLELSPKLSHVRTRYKAEISLQACLRSRMIKLAKTENVFARGVMLQHEIAQQNEKGINYWYRKIQLMLTTTQYQEYTECGQRI